MTKRKQLHKDFRTETFWSGWTALCGKDIGITVQGTERWPLCLECVAELRTEGQELGLRVGGRANSQEDWKVPVPQLSIRHYKARLLEGQKTTQDLGTHSVGNAHFIRLYICL